MAGLKFRILLDNSEDKEIFRDIVINENINFEQFYHAIIDAFQLSNNQLASFFVSDGGWNKGEEISLLDMSFGEIDQAGPIEMNALKLKERINAPHQRFILVHDFLSMWIFLIELQKVVESEIETAQLVLSVGEIPANFKESGPQSVDNMRFEADIDEDFDPFSHEDFENIDDFDL